MYIQWLIIHCIKYWADLVFRRVFRSNRFKADYKLTLKKHFEIIRLLFRKEKIDNLTVIAVEPNTAIVEKCLKKISKHYEIIRFPFAILGHDADKDYGIESFLIYNDDLSNSLYEKKHLGNM